MRAECLPLLPAGCKLRFLTLDLNQILTGFHLATWLGDQPFFETSLQPSSPLFFSHFLPLLTSAHGGSRIFES